MKHGRYAQHLTLAEAAILTGDQGDDLSVEVGLLRALLDRVLTWQPTDAAGHAQLVSLAADLTTRLAKLIETREKLRPEKSGAGLGGDALHVTLSAMTLDQLTALRVVWEDQRLLALRDALTPLLQDGSLLPRAIEEEGHDPDSE